jgi:hypothetical protein
VGLEIFNSHNVRPKFNKNGQISTNGCMQVGSQKEREKKTSISKFLTS